MRTSFNGALWEVLFAVVIFTSMPALAEPSDPPSNTIPVSAPLTTDSTGISGQHAAQSVLRVICPKESLTGTGFLHRSGKIITAAHVIGQCSEILVVGVTMGAPIKVTAEATDSEIDLALLSPERAIPGSPLTISPKSDFPVGAQVSTWGFPLGYGGTIPLLSAGYLSGADALKTPNGRLIMQWVVNAAFNLGNSGGPLLDVATGEVIGVVSSKLAPLSPTTITALKALSNQRSGVLYPATLPDGSQKVFTEGQIVSMVLDELRGQVQLVLGRAVMVNDLRLFLAAKSIQP